MTATAHSTPQAPQAPQAPHVQPPLLPTALPRVTPAEAAAILAVPAELDSLSALRRAWRQRPDDAYYPNLIALVLACEEHEARCSPHHKPVHDLVVHNDDESVYVQGKGPVFLTHQAFRQLCSLLGAPATFLQARTPRLVRDTLREMVGGFAGRSLHNFLSCSEPGEGGRIHWVVECVTGTGYGRIYNSQVALAIQHVNRSGRWVPAGPTALARSRHSCDLAFVDPSTEIAVDPTGSGPGEVFHPAFSAFNSIAGDRSFGLIARAHLPRLDIALPVGKDAASALFRHSKLALERFQREAAPVLEAFATTDWSRTRADYAHAQRTPAGDDEAISRLLKASGLTQRERKGVWDYVGPAADGKVTRWQLAVAVATYARDHAPFAEERLRLEGLSASLLRA